MSRGPRAASGAKIIATGMMLSATLLGTALIAATEPSATTDGGQGVPPAPDVPATLTTPANTDAVRDAPSTPAPTRALPANPAATASDGTIAPPAPILVAVPAAGLPWAPMTQKS